MKFISVTSKTSDKKTAINVAHIVKLFSCKDGDTGITLTDTAYGRLYVKETVEEILGMIEG